MPNSKPWITDGDKAAVQAVLDNPVFGHEVAAFERELAEFLGRKYVVCVSSGTVALELAHRAGYAGSTITRAACNAFGFVATPNAVERAGFSVRFSDTANTTILGDVTGAGCDRTIRDACQAFGAKLPQSLADCYSFNWNKPITCLGGGCVATDDLHLAGDVRALANQGRWFGTDMAQAAGTNARMSDMQAALGRSQLRRVGEILERRRQVARWYWENLPVCGKDAYKTAHPSRFLYPIELSNRDEVHAKMLERGIQTRSCADWLLPAHPYYAEKYGYKRGDFPEAERRADRTLLLPLYPEMTLDQVREVCEALEECDAKN